MSINRFLLWLSACVLPLTLVAQAPPATPVETPAAAPAPASPSPVAPAASVPTAAPTAPASAGVTSAAEEPLSQRPKATDGPYVQNRARRLPLKNANPGGPVYVFPLKGEFNEPQLSFFRRVIKDAERAKASALIIDMDTPGGYAHIAGEMQELIRKASFSTLTFVNPDAGSAGALLALGTRRIYVRPNSVIGAAALVTSMGEDIGKTMKSKLDSFHTGKMRVLCEENGYNPDVGEAFMVLEKELRLGDTILDGKETLLTLTGREAAKLYDGQPLLAHGLVESVEEICKAEGFTGTIVRIEQTGFESFAFWVTKFAPLLLIGGILGGYIEMKAPGFGIPGICSIICFALYFGGHFLAGLAGFEVMFIFLIGVILVLVEFFLLPGTFVAGLIGTFMMLGALLWAMVDYWPSTPGLPSGAAFEGPITNLVVALLGTTLAIAIVARFLPKTAFYRHLVLSSASAGGPAVSIPVVNLSVRPGDLGSATTVLRPAGKGVFKGEVHDVLTSGEFLPAGTPIRVLETDGLQVLVEKAG